MGGLSSSKHSLQRYSESYTMSSALTFIVLGNVYLLGNNSPPGFDRLPSLDQLRTAEPQVAPVKRQDYTYTPDIGAHKVHLKAAKWNDARQICRGEGGDLAVINSEAESRVLAQLLTSSGPPIGSDRPSYHFIGIHDMFKEGQWETVDGKTLLEAGFDTWAPPDPTAYYGENCGTITHGGQLVDADCDINLVFICELSKFY